MSFIKKLFKKQEEPIKNYQDFWLWFQKYERGFHQVVKKQGNIEKDFFNKIAPRLNQVKEGIRFLTGMYDDHTVELVLTPDGAVKNIVFVEELVNAAPPMAGWRFTALKPESDIEHVGMEMYDYIFGAETLTFFPGDDQNYPDNIEITVVHRDYKPEDRDQIVHGIYIFLDNYLGELNFVTTIDDLTVAEASEVDKDTIPIAKLKDYLIWREKEFQEKYESQGYNTEHDTYSGVEFQLKNGSKVIATINTSLLQWDGKASHPWLMSVKIHYNGANHNGMPDEATYKLLDDFEEEIMQRLKDEAGYLNIGRETGDHLREIYFACKEFRTPSLVLDELVKKYTDQLDIDYDFYKDKYWKAMERYQVPY